MGLGELGLGEMGRNPLSKPGMRSPSPLLLGPRLPSQPQIISDSTKSYCLVMSEQISVNTSLMSFSWFK